MRQFYLMFSKRDAAHLKSEDIVQDSAVRSELSWTHCRLLLRVENDNLNLNGSKRIRIQRDFLRL